jgi:hypothetical protein
MGKQDGIYVSKLRFMEWTKKETSERKWVQAH